MRFKSIFAGNISKALLVISVLILGISGLSLCSAQSTVVGKWKEISVKQYYSPESAKEMGKAFIEGAAPGGSTYHWEFKADHTYVVEGGNGGGKSNTSNGQWSVIGNQLTMKAKSQVEKGAAGQIYTFVITGNRMTRTQMMAAPYNDVVIKVEDISERM